MDAPSAPGLAVVAGARGGVGAALVARLQADRRYARVLGLHRAGEPPLDLTCEASVVRAGEAIAQAGAPLRRVIVATGVLHGPDLTPERGWRDLDPEAMAKAFAINTIGPALLMKHWLPLLPRDEPSVFAVLSAKVGSIGDNRLGGWWSYRASKAALNQLVRTAAVELRRARPQACVAALHPGTVDTPLSAPFAKRGLTVRPPDEAAERLLSLCDRLGPGDSGGFFDASGEALPW